MMCRISARLDLFYKGIDCRLANSCGVVDMIEINHPGGWIAHFELRNCPIFNLSSILYPGGFQWAQKVKPSGLARFKAKIGTLRVISQKSLLELGGRGISGLYFCYNQNVSTTSMEVWKSKLGNFAYSRNPAWLHPDYLRLKRSP